MSNEVQKMKTTQDSNCRCFAHYDSQRLLAQSVTTIHSGAGSRYPQGATIDLENDRFYISRQTSGEYQDQMIYEYDLNTQQLLRNQSVPIGVRVYLEGLVYFRNSSQQLCFIVPVDRYGKFGIFNFDTGQMEKEFSMEGNFKVGVDNHHKYFLCGRNEDPLKDPNANMDGVFLYDFASVVAGDPVLVETVQFLHEQMFINKVQGITMIDDYILLGQGVEYLSMSVLDLNGRLVHKASYDSKEIITLIGGNPDSTNLQVECEGISWITEDGRTYPILFPCSQGKASIVKLGDLQMVRI
ncbi:hypothetical protein G4V62_02405 [Bacillaceae bacterium SIJ1]|uniref:hypothetical protein n=1 Tax=Litoribacterium kuwaitense TaxID=1398745 RepID=UPI0013ED2132|nr:hypothetical protein [Litoribacterium kuwaitense]NGP43853.1 hypothetical protein [Litoribacterium kuwaitense]